MASKKSSKKASKKSLPVTHISCPSAEGGLCVTRAFATQMVTEALISTVWSHREDHGSSVEFSVHEVVAIPTPGVEGHFTLGVSVTKLGGQSAEVVAELPLHEFFKEFVPVRDIAFADFHS